MTADTIYVAYIHNVRLASVDAGGHRITIETLS